MTASNAPEPSAGHGYGILGPVLRRAVAGYWQLIGAELTAAGFADRRFPEGRVLFMCRTPGQITISEIGRRLGITRQAAGKIVAGLKERGYLDVTPSPTDGRVKTLSLTPLAEQFLTALQHAGHVVESRLRTELGDEGFGQLVRGLDVLAELQGPHPAH
jgi:DNA-binding MarR family transcriptional regulator